jgi:hypothetical protein
MSHQQLGYGGGLLLRTLQCRNGFKNTKDQSTKTILSEPSLSIELSVSLIQAGLRQGWTVKSTSVCMLGCSPA